LIPLAPATVLTLVFCTNMCAAQIYRRAWPAEIGQEHSRRRGREEPKPSGTSNTASNFLEVISVRAVVVGEVALADLFPTHLQQQMILELRL